MEEAGFKKIEFNSDTNSSKPAVSRLDRINGKKTDNSMKKRKFIKFPKLNKKLLGPIGIVLLLLVLLGAYVGFKSFAIYKQARAVEAQARKVADAAKLQNVVIAKDELVKTKAEAEKLKSEIGGIGFLKIIPFFGGYVSDADHMVAAGIHGINAGIITTDSLIPYADVLGLKGESSFTGGSAEERIRTAIKTLDKVVPKIDDIEKEMLAAKEEIDHVNPSRYPKIGPIKKAHDAVVMVKTLVDEGALAVDQGKPLIKVLPELLGAEKARKYLILFQNDGELRPTGGFLTYYSIFRIEEGVIHIDMSQDIYDLDASIPSHPKADPIILKYLPKVPTQNIRDINLSPDFQVSMADFREFYERSSNSTEIDGIIALDTDFMVDLIRILGGVEAAGQTFSADIDPDCNCPQVVYQLQLNTTKPVGFVRENRKEIVGSLMYATMQKALQSSPKEYWGQLFQAAIKNAQEKHIVFSLNNEEAQKGIEALNWGGTLKEFDGDYIHINDANFGGAKSNIFVTSSARVDYNVKNGEIEKVLTIDYKNPEKYSDCNLESGGLCLNAILRNFQRVYVPEGSTLVTSKGSEVKVETKEDLGKTYFESFFTVNPLGKATITYTYKLPFKVENGVLPLMIQKQPGIANVPFEIFVNGRKVEAFDLRADKTINLKI